MRYLLLFLTLVLQLNVSGYNLHNPQESHVQKTLTSENTNSSERSDILFRYQGQYEDVETGLYYNRFRYYDPSIGSYISPDPIGLAGNNPTLYAYVHDLNSWIDVLGLSIIPVKTYGSNGEIVSASARVTRGDLGTGTNTNASSRRYARNLGNLDDDAGHIIGRQLGGSGGRQNVFPQDFHVNRGAFAQFEGDVADFIDVKGSAKISVDFEYANGGTRPTAVSYSVEGPNGEKMANTPRRFPNVH